MSLGMVAVSMHLEISKTDQAKCCLLPLIPLVPRMFVLDSFYLYSVLSDLRSPYNVIQAAEQIVKMNNITQKSLVTTMLRKTQYIKHKVNSVT